MEILSSKPYYYSKKPQGVGPCGGGLGLGVCFLLRSKVQHLMSTNNSLGPHSLVKSQQFNQFRVEKLLKVRCIRLEFTLMGRSEGPCLREVLRHKKKKKTHILLIEPGDSSPKPWRTDDVERKVEGEALGCTYQETSSAQIVSIKWLTQIG